MLIEMASILFALGLPSLTGGLFIWAVWPARRPGYGVFLASASFPLGLVGVIGGYILLDLLGVGLDYSWNVALQVASALALGAVLIRRRMAGKMSWGDRTNESGWSDLPGWSRWVMVSLIVWLVLRWTGVLLEVIYRPLFPWDAWMSYGLQARIWFHAEQLDVFCSRMEWFASDPGCWTARGTRHPPGVGLIQLWMAQSLGRWDESLINLPWVIAYAGIGAGVHAVLRFVGVGILLAVVCAWLAMSLPVLTTHAVLAGYADIWVALYLLLLGGGVLFAHSAGQQRVLLITIPAVIGLLLVKLTGIFWFVILAVGLLWTYLGTRQFLVFGAIAGVFVLAALWIYPEPIHIKTVGEFSIGFGGWQLPGFHPVLGRILNEIFVAPGWHLLGYLLVLSVCVSGIIGDRTPECVLLEKTGMISLAALAVLFFFTGVGANVEDLTRINRILLHLAPCAVLYVGGVAWRLSVLNKYRSPVANAGTNET